MGIKWNAAAVQAASHDHSTLTSDCKSHVLHAECAGCLVVHEVTSVFECDDLLLL